MSDNTETRVSDGEKVVGKIKRGTGTRDQDTLKLVGRGETAEEAAEDFEQLLKAAEDGNWSDRLRELQAESDD